jgi:hypothetical protein
MPRARPTKFPLCFFSNSRKRTSAKSTHHHLDNEGTPLSRSPPKYKPQPNRAKSTTHQVSAGVLHFSNNTASKPKSEDAKSPTQQVSAVFLRIPQNESPREVHILTLTIRANRCQRRTHTQTTTQSGQQHHPPSFRCVLCTFQTTRPPSQNQKRQEPHPPSFRCFFVLRISENAPPREAYIITLTTKAHRFQKLHPRTNHNPIRPRAPPTKFPACFYNF